MNSERLCDTGFNVKMPAEIATRNNCSIRPCMGNLFYIKGLQLHIHWRPKADTATRQRLHQVLDSFNFTKLQCYNYMQRSRQFFHGYYILQLYSTSVCLSSIIVRQCDTEELHSCDAMLLLYGPNHIFRVTPINHIATPPLHKAVALSECGLNHHLPIIVFLQLRVP